MITLLLHLLRLLPFLCAGHRQVALENLALRHQLAVYRRTAPRPKHGSPLLGRAGQGLGRVETAPRDLVTPTPSCGGSGVASASTGPSSPPGPPAAARPSTPRSKSWSWNAAANPLWGAPRIHGELLKLGIHMAERSVPRLLPKRRTPPSQTWRTFLANHVRDLVSLDFFTAPRALARALRSRRIRSPSPAGCPLQRDEHPTAHWTAQQIVDAFPNDSAPSYLLRDRDHVYCDQLRHRVKSMQIEEVITAPQSSWQNPFVERLIGSIRRECLNHVLVFGERHLRRILARYFAYYHRARTVSLDKDTPDGRPIEPVGLGTIMAIPEVGRLHHRYVRRAA